MAAKVRDRAFASPVRIDFDAESDVLYIAHGKPVPAESDGQPEGIELRYALSNNMPCGVTVIGYKHYHWNRRVNALATIVSNHIGVPERTVADEIERATRER